jgi:hypothetical protein
MPRYPRRVPPPPHFLGPCRDRLRIRSGQPARVGRLASQRFIELAFADTLEDPGHLGEEITAGQRGHRGGSLVRGELALPGLAGRLRDEYPVDC